MTARLPSVDELQSLTLNYREGNLEISRRDGARINVATEVQPAFGVLAISLDVASETLELLIDGFSPFEVELWPKPNDPRPIVYLDQLHWISLAKALNGTDMDNDLNRAAIELIALARDRRISLPLSGAHAVEMAKTYGDRRRNLAGVMLELSRGWQMVSPLSIRLQELTGMFLCRQTGRLQSLSKSDVFTLNPRALWTDQYSRNRAQETSNDGLPPDIQDLVSRMIWIQGFYSTLAEDKRHDSSEGRDVAHRWADSLNELAQHMSGNPRARPYKRDLTRAKFMSDIQSDLVMAAQASGISNVEFEKWLADEAEESIGKLPHLGRARELTHYRLVNAQDSWEVNDLNDLLFLSCAAGYADVVVAERKFGNYLRRTLSKFPTGSQIFLNIPDALATLTQVIN